MPIEYTRLAEEHLEDLQGMLLPFWERRWDRSTADRFFRWRFLERSDGEGLIAYDRGRPVGFVDSFVRPYRTPRGTLQVHEPAEWYSDPAYRPLLGMKLTRRLMERPEPALTVGGNRNTASLLPRLGHQELPELVTYALPTGGGAMVKGLSKSLGFPMSAVPRLLARPLSGRLPNVRRVPPGNGSSRVRPIPNGEPVPRLGPRDGSYGIAPILGGQDCRWFRRAPDSVGSFVWLAFERAGETTGVSFSRLYREGPFTAARLLHLDAVDPSVPTYEMMVRETVRELMVRKPQWIGARFSCPMSREALEKVGFRRVGHCRAFWWHQHEPPPDGPLHLSWASADEPLLPYPA